MLTHLLLATALLSPHAAARLEATRAQESAGPDTTFASHDSLRVYLMTMGQGRYIYEKFGSSHSRCPRI